MVTARIGLTNERLARVNVTKLITVKVVCFLGLISKVIETVLEIWLTKSSVSGHLLTHPTHGSLGDPLSPLVRIDKPLKGFGKTKHTPITAFVYSYNDVSADNDKVKRHTHTHTQIRKPTHAGIKEHGRRTNNATKNPVLRAYRHHTQMLRNSERVVRNLRKRTGRGIRDVIRDRARVHTVFYVQRWLERHSATTASVTVSRWKMKHGDDRRTRRRTTTEEVEIVEIRHKLECGPMPNVMAALSNTGGVLCSTPQSMADAHY